MYDTTYNSQWLWETQRRISHWGTEHGRQHEQYDSSSLTCQAHQQASQSLPARSSSRNQHSPALASYQVPCTGSWTWTATELDNPALGDPTETCSRFTSQNCLALRQAKSKLKPLGRFSDIRFTERELSWQILLNLQAGRLKSTMSREWLRCILLEKCLKDLWCKADALYLPSNWEVVLLWPVPGTHPVPYLIPYTTYMDAHVL